MFRCISILFIFFSCLIIYQTSHSIYPNYKTYSFIQFEGTVIHSVIIKNKKNNTYQPKISYSYQPYDEKLISNHIRLNSEPVFRYYNDANIYLMNYPVGRKVHTYFNFDNVKEVVLEPGFHEEDYTKMLVYTPIVLAALLFFSLTFIDNKKFNTTNSPMCMFSFSMLIGLIITCLGSFLIVFRFSNFLDYYIMYLFISIYLFSILLCFFLKKINYVQHINHKYKREFNTTEINSIEEKPLRSFLFTLRKKAMLPLLSINSLSFITSFYLFQRNNFSINNDIIILISISFFISFLYVLIFFKKQYPVYGKTTSLN